jgi:uncharacterized damage-inducible protein DinB
MNMTQQTTGQAASSALAFLDDDMDAELASTRRMLARVPDGQGSWRPHEKSKTLSELATHVADCVGLAATILETDELDALARPRREPLATSAEPPERLAENEKRLRAALGTVDDDRLASERTLRAGDRVFVRRKRSALLRVMFLSHMIHHRAQLGVYLRLLDVPVPGLYGPSADEDFRC